MSAEPDAARLRRLDDRPDRLTFASPPEPVAACAAAAALWAVEAAGAELSCWVRVAALPVRLSGMLLVVESIFTIGFLNYLIPLTAFKKPNFSSIDVAVCNGPTGRLLPPKPSGRHCHRRHFQVQINPASTSGSGPSNCLSR